MAATPIEGPTLSHWQRKIAFSESDVSRGRFGELNPRCCISAGGVPRFVPPEGGFINFLAKMAESVSRYRWAKTVPRRNGHATRPTVRIGLSTSRGRLVPLLAVLCHDS